MQHLYLLLLTVSTTVSWGKVLAVVPASTLAIALCCHEAARIFSGDSADGGDKMPTPDEVLNNQASVHRSGVSSEVGSSDSPLLLT